MRVHWKSYGIGWILIIFLSLWLVATVLLNASKNNHEQTAFNPDNIKRLDNALEMVEKLRMQNVELKQLLSDLSSVSNDNGKLLEINAKVNSLSDSNFAGSMEISVPNPGYEQKRRFISTHARELGFYVNAELEGLVASLQEVEPQIVHKVTTMMNNFKDRLRYEVVFCERAYFV